MPDLYTAKQTFSKSKVINQLPMTANSLTAFALKPLGINFENQKSDEEIILLLRKHWFTNLGWIFLGFFGIFISLLFVYFPAVSILPIKHKIMVVLGCFLLLTAFIFEKFLSWFFNVGIITNQRVVDIDFYGLLYKEISDAELDKIEDVTQKQVGAIRTMFDFGNVFIQTAGQIPMIEFTDIPHPRKVVKLLQELR